MVTSVHLADVGLMTGGSLVARGFGRRRPRGLLWDAFAVTAPLGPGLVPRPDPTSVGLVAVWRDTEALSAFEAGGHPVTTGWATRLEAVRVVGAWPGLPGLPEHEEPVGDGPVAVLTLGRLKPTRALAFLRASAAAERDALADPALVLSTGLARPPRTVATFSRWRDGAAMRAYVEGHHRPGHRDALTVDAARGFHASSAFIRYRVLGERGHWAGRDTTASSSDALPTAATIDGRAA